MENIFLHKKVSYLQSILNDINEQDTPFLDCKYKHMWKVELHLTMSESCTASYLYSMVSKAELISKGYHCLVLGLISIFYGRYGSL